eukprot:2331906-Rhodomonas_salina.2
MARSHGKVVKFVKVHFRHILPDLDQVTELPQIMSASHRRFRFDTKIRCFRVDLLLIVLNNAPDMRAMPGGAQAFLSSVQRRWAWRAGLSFAKTQ